MPWPPGNVHQGRRVTISTPQRRACARYVPQTGHSAHHRVRAQTQKERVKRAPTPSLYPRPERGAPRGDTDIYTTTAYAMALTPAHSHQCRYTNAAIVAPPPPRNSRGIPANAGREPMPMHTDPSVAEGNNPRAICSVTPAPTPCTRAPGQRREHPGPAGSCAPTRTAPERTEQGGKRPQCQTYAHTSVNATPTSRRHRGDSRSSPDPAGFRAPDHRTARGRAHAPGCAGQGGKSPGPNTSAHQRQRHGYEQAQPGCGPDPAGFRAPTTGLRAAVPTHRRAQTCGSAH